MRRGEGPLENESSDCSREPSSGQHGKLGGARRNPEDIAPGAIVGFFLGYSGAVAVDAAVLAREEVKREPSQAYSLQLLPIRGVDGRMKLTGAGLAGRF